MRIGMLGLAGYGDGLPTLVWKLALLSVVTATGACSPRGVGEAGEGGEGAAMEPQEVEVVTGGEEAPALHMFRPDQLWYEQSGNGFAHEAHRELDCSSCHDQPRGHGAHAPLTCAECHRSGAETNLELPAPEDCQSCHHGPEQLQECVACHEVPGVLVSAQELDFAVWDEPRSRGLEFRHAIHGAEDCALCHVRAPALTPAESCATCHPDHHEADVTCSACHVAAPEEAHDLGVHQTCSGGGCHQDSVIEALSQTRTVCLVCHEEQENHESAEECTDCHRVRAEPRDD